MAQFKVTAIQYRTRIIEAGSRDEAEQLALQLDFDDFDAPPLDDFEVEDTVRIED
jgi:hypothetical protein